MGRITKVQSREEPLNPLCKKAYISSGEYGGNGKCLLCLGIVNRQNDEPFDMCVSCDAFIRSKTPPKGSV